MRGTIFQTGKIECHGFWPGRFGNFDKFFIFINNYKACRRHEINGAINGSNLKNDIYTHIVSSRMSLNFVLSVKKLEG